MILAAAVSLYAVGLREEWPTMAPWQRAYALAAASLIVLVYVVVWLRGWDDA